MQFSTFALSALSIGSALAAGTSQVTVHVVQVGAANGSLAFYPDNIKAAAGDMIQFQFAPNNHTITQSNFDNPCQPIAMHSNMTGIYSGFMPVSASSTTTPTWTVMVNSTTPMWLYCSQGKHCMNGMTMVINENTAANATRSLANYKALAAKATVNLPGGTVADGAASSIASGSGSSSGSTTTTGSSGTDSGSSSNTGSTETGNSTSSSTGSASSGKTSTTTTSAAVGAKERVGGVLSLVGVLAMGVMMVL